MGLSLKWMAIRGGGRDLLLDRLGFDPIGEASDGLNANYACCELPGGWCVFVGNYPLEGAMKDMPSGFLVLAGEAHETVMFSSLRAYRDGGQLWSVVHDPDKDHDGVAVEGEPPAPFADLKRELDATQAAEDERVDHMFGLPAGLGKRLCGYDPGQQEGLVWTVLGANGSDVRPAPRSIVDAIRSELVPYLQSLGWEAPKNSADVSSSENILRHIDGQVQTVFFRFMSGPQTYIQVIFETQGKRPSGHSHPVRGELKCDRILPKAGKWQGFFKPRLPPPDPIDGAIQRAKADILIAEEFLRTDEVNPNIRLYRGLEPVEDDAWRRSARLKSARKKRALQDLVRVAIAYNQSRSQTKTTARKPKNKTA